MIGSSFQTLGAATEKARLPKLSFVLGTISCCEVDDLSCLGIFERCMIKHVITWVLGFPLNTACMIRSVILVIDTRFWSSAHFTAPPTPPTAAPCRLRVAEAVNIVDLPILVALGLVCALVCVLEYK